MVGGAAQDLIRFHGEGIEPGALRILRLEGSEGLNELFRFDLLVESDRPDWDLGELLRAACILEIGHGVLLPDGGRAGVRMLPYHGVLAGVEQRQRVDDRYLFQLELVPALWRLELSWRSRVFLEKEIPEILKQILEEGGVRQVDFRLQDSYPSQACVQQYQESDLAFLRRLCEREGIAWFFEHDDEHSTLVFADHGDGFATVPADERVAYRPGEMSWGEDETYSGSWFSEPMVRSVVCRQRPVTGKVVIRDYQPQTPDQDLTSDRAVEVDAGFGYRYEFGGALADAAASDRYARLRCEELASGARRFEGVASSRAFRAGATFELDEHFRPDFNQKYLLLEVRHRARREQDQYVYGNRFAAAPATTVFRPLRRTPSPAIVGTVPARVDAAGSGDYAELDDQGRYRVRFLYDLERDAGSRGTASPPLRMAQPYGGDEWGLHFPLHKDTEVALGFHLGDPDRPYIHHTLPNPRTPSRVVDRNQTQCVLTTGAANELVIEDQSGSEEIKWHAVRDHTLLVDRNASTVVSGDTNTSVKGDVQEHVEGQRQTRIDGKDTLTVDGTRDVTVSGDHTQTLGANAVVEIGGKSIADIGGSSQVSVGGDRLVRVAGSQENSVGSSVNLVAGTEMALQSGANTVLDVGASLSISAGANTSLQTGAVLTVDGTQVNINGAAGILLTVGGASIALSPAGIDISAPTISINGSAMVDIKGGLIKQNV